MSSCNCSRCGGDRLLQWNGPWGSSVWMELCPACDAERPSAGTSTVLSLTRRGCRGCSRTGRPGPCPPTVARAEQPQAPACLLAPAGLPSRWRG
ncbi:DUF6300 family protein [Streptomyces tuirus]